MRNGKYNILVRSRAGRGFAMADVVLGMSILAVLATAFFTSVHRQRRGAERLADMRGATWDAEYALAVMQLGRAADAPALANVHVEPTSDASAAPVAAPGGYTWVRVRAERNGRSATLVGLVPRGAVPEAKAEGSRP